MRGLGRSFALRRAVGTPHPSMSYSATSLALPPGFTHTRASKATYFDSTGTLQEAANDVPRFDYDPVTLAFRGLLIEDAKTNYITNPRAEGAVAGTPGTLPTNWSQYAGGGLTRAVVATGTEYGMTYVDIRWSGTATSNAENTIYFPSPSSNAAQGQQWCASVFARLVGGSLANLNGVSLRLFELNNVGGYLVESGASMALTSTLTRYSIPRQLTSATVAFATSQVTVNATGAGAVVDLTIRYYCPQLEFGAACATNPILPTAGTIATSTRSRDDITALSPSWLNPAEGTIVAYAVHADSNRYNYGSMANYARVFSLVDNSNPTANYVMAMAYNSTSGIGVTLNSVNQANLPSYGTDWRTTQKLAYGWKTNAIAFTRNGAAVTLSSSTGTVPAVNRVNLAAAEDSISWKLNGYITKFDVYPRRLSDQQLQRLST